MKGLLAAGSVGAYFFAKNFTRPLLRLVNYRVEDLLVKEKPEEVYLKAKDGIQLYGRYIKRGEKHVLLLHGYHSSPSRDFSTMVPYFIKKGYSVFLPDIRSHGKSGGNLITFGMKECHDALKWINYLVAEGVKEILVYGVSMGAATTLLLRNLDLPKEVKLMIVDCPYIDAYAQVVEEASKYGKALSWVGPSLSSGLLLFGLPLKEILPYTGLKKIGVPLLFIHGTADTFVPAKNSVRAYVDSEDECELHLFKGAPHARSMKMYPKEYVKVVEEFLKKYGYLN